MKKLLVAALFVAAMAARAFALDTDGSQVDCNTSTGTLIGTPGARVSLSMYNDDSTNPVYYNKAGTTAGDIIPPKQGRIVDFALGGETSADKPLKCKSTGGTVTLYIRETWKR